MELGIHRSWRLPSVGQVFRRALARVNPSLKRLPPLGLPPVPRLAIDLGPGLDHLTDPQCRSGIAPLLPILRRDLLAELGFFMPEVVHRNDPELPAGAYRIRVLDMPVAGGEVVPDRVLIPETAELAAGPLRVREPGTGRLATWSLVTELDGKQRARSRSCGQVIVGHLAEVVRDHASELLDSQTLERMIAAIRDQHPLVVHAAEKTGLYQEGLLDSLRRLLSEYVSIRDLATILEHLLDLDRFDLDRDLRADFLRQRLARQICNAVGHEDRSIHALLLEEQTFRRLWGAPDGIYPSADTVQFHPLAAQPLRAAVERALARAGFPEDAVVLTSPPCRLLVRRALESGFRRLPVLSFGEIHPAFHVRVLGEVT